jgi:hypothetical protein
LRAPHPDPARAAPASRPNFVFILTDDQSLDSLAPGAPVVMPTLEAHLADPNDHWVRFTRSEPDGVPGDEAATLTITVNAARPSARLWIARW